MRDFSWKYFSITGDVDAYLLYKEYQIQPGEEPELPEQESAAEAPETMQ
ncbi:MULTISPECIES: YqzL family protein [Paenibacillus]|uniref:YqzL-like protein n=1 Tax=Paenibacillus naphthalenovorans TaxID=162209 RepID=A0A0U2W1C6_9BACL|nr:MULTISPECIES: YqzL family protein [Paenibacillus]ALS21317.1 YqzL-like protein [Paenibacillus naphthalenovorans]NTZ18521.1 YqzL family protein [Paenibacillus sp. JMULE4]GCL72573.1 YqzL family protein [Paenibacillus naphthalenovorans]SDH97045.1 YqzL-like protein [Paenibacillus naphthalenovorans]